MTRKETQIEYSEAIVILTLTSGSAIYTRILRKRKKKAKQKLQKLNFSEVCSAIHLKIRSITQ